MTAAVAPLPLPTVDLFLPESSAEARKRRRDILASQRTGTVSDSDEASCEPPIAKKSKLAASKKAASKKPQMKYDPDVPMTKEQAAAWRREQRRKRNRESAAASRQRQRDRIDELEAEVNEWKVKYEGMMSKIRQLETLHGMEPSESYIRSESPRPSEVQTVTPRSSPLSSPPQTSDGIVEFVKAEDDEEGYQHQSKMISRPAQSRITT